MKKLRLFSFSLLLLACSMLLSNCSKDKKLERTLHKKEGVWNISSVTWQKVIVTSSGQTVSLGTTANAGTFTFDKDGTGSYSFTVDGSGYSRNFTWSVTDENIKIVRVSTDIDFSTGNVDQLTIAIVGEQKSKNSIELGGTETHVYSSGPTTESVLTGTFSLTKQ
jgi:hypothetical protein